MPTAIGAVSPNTQGRYFQDSKNGKKCYLKNKEKPLLSCPHCRLLADGTISGMDMTPLLYLNSKS